jgi:hypothetical protein
MPHRPPISLIVPTRGRVAKLRRFLDSLAATAAEPEGLEVVLVVDEDDAASASVAHPRLAVKPVVGPPGRTMGALNGAGYAASSGAWLMLLNDDVVARTPGWDRRLRTCFHRFPDGVLLVHVNDTLFRDELCTFPVVSRTFCELAGGICPAAYHRYRIDDHIEDVFNLLAALGARRSVYLPDVVFEHLNAVALPQGGEVYLSDPDILALDAPLFDALFAQRKELALGLLEYIEGGSRPAVTAARRRRLAEMADPFALRVAGRQRLEMAERLRRLASRVAERFRRARHCLRQRGYRGLARAAIRRLGFGLAFDSPEGAG